MSQEERIKKLESEIQELTTQISKAKNYVVIGGPILIGLLTAFFGISYNKIGVQVDEAVTNHINATAFEKSTAKLKEASLSAKKEIEESVRNTNEIISGFRAETKNKYDTLLQKIPSIHETMQKLSTYEALANSKVEQIEKSVIKAEKLVPSIKRFSVYGEVKNGGEIPVPSGTVADWSVIISPKYIGLSGAGIAGTNTPLLSANYSVQVASPTTWHVRAISRYKFGKSEKIHEGKVNYLIVPSILTKEVSAN